MSIDELFVWPAGLPLLLIAPALLVALRVGDGLRTRRLARTLGPRWQMLASEMSLRQRRVRRRLASVAMLCGLLALLQPTYGEDARSSERRGVDIVVCLDVSRSMLARDVAPTRLAAAQRAIRALADRTHGDRLALVVFAGDARLLVPVTHDVATFAELVALADPASVDRGGTDLGAALDAAASALDVGARTHAAVLLLTDGEDHEGQGLDAARRLAQSGVVVHCMGIGSVVGSKIAIAADDPNAPETFLRGRDGEDVVSAMSPSGLRAIAAATGGECVEALGDESAALVELYVDHIAAMAQQSFDAGERRERGNRYQWPLLCAVLLWLIELAITDRRRSIPSNPLRS